MCVLLLSVSLHLVCLFFFFFSCHVHCSIKTSNSFTSVCSLLYSVGLITTNYSLQLHRIQPHVVLTHVCKGYVWGEGGTLNSRSKGTRHLLCQRCPTHSPFSFSPDPNRWFFPSRPATHTTAVFKAASLWHALLSNCGVNRQRRDYMKHFVTFVTSKQWLLDGPFVFFKSCLHNQGPGLHIPFMTIDNDVFLWCARIRWILDTTDCLTSSWLCGGLEFRMSEKVNLFRCRFLAVSCWVTEAAKNQDQLGGILFVCLFFLFLSFFCNTAEERLMYMNRK